MQTASAFSSVQTALSFFINAYRQLAEWRAVIERLDGFDAAVDKAQAAATTQARNRGAAARRQACGRDRRPAGAAAAGRAAGRRRRHRRLGRRARAAHRPVRRGQVDAVPRDRRHLAVRHGHRSGAEGRQADGPAAAALFPGRHARGRGELPGRAGHLQRAGAGRGRHGGRAAGTRRAAGGGSALEPDALARRAAAPRRSPAPSCRRPTICSSTRRPPRSTSRPRPRSTACSTSASRAPRSCRSAIARRWSRSTAAASRSHAREISIACARPPRRRQPNRRSPPADRPGAATEQVVPDEGPRPRAVTRQWPRVPRESPRTCC